jgi:hypothetical protein
MRMTGRRKVVIVSVLVLLAIQVVTYLTLSSSRIPSLALDSTPEKTHFAPGASFSWVLLRLEKCKGLSEAQKERLLSVFRTHYSAVYTDDAEVPADLVQLGPRDHVNYYGGFSYDFSVVSRGPFWVRVYHRDHEGSRAASTGKHVYIWVIGSWIKVYDGPMEVA